MKFSTCNFGNPWIETAIFKKFLYFLVLKSCFNSDNGNKAFPSHRRAPAELTSPIHGFTRTHTQTALRLPTANNLQTTRLEIWWAFVKFINLFWTTRSPHILTRIDSSDWCNLASQTKLAAVSSTNVRALSHNFILKRYSCQQYVGRSESKFSVIVSCLAESFSK